VRSSFYKYLHPKEVFIAEGVLVPDLALKKNDVISGASRKPNGSVKQTNPKSKHSDKLNFVYPYGSSLNIQRPSKPFLSSGPISFPVNRPLAGFWESETVAVNAGKRGRLVVIGSVEIFSDDWIDKEENGKLCDLLFAWLLNEIDLDMTSDRQDSDLSEHTSVPNMDGLSQVIKPCLQGIDELPRDFINLFDGTMFKFDVDMIPQVLKMYEILAVAHNPLTLIPPQFECPMPKMIPATFPPSMREPPPPSLDQFDLEDHFARQDIRLAQLTNKCAQGEEDLEYYIAEAGEVLGVIQNLPFGERSAKHILFNILSSIVDYKMTEDHKHLAPSHVNGYEYDDSGVIGFGKLASQNDEGPTLEATNMPIHIPRVDLVPIQSQRSLQIS
jgi:intraflagellar transport protein 52